MRSIKTIKKVVTVNEMVDGLIYEIKLIDPQKTQRYRFIFHSIGEYNGIIDDLIGCKKLLGYKEWSDGDTVFYHSGVFQMVFFKESDFGLVTSDGIRFKIFLVDNII
jgi:hypothetical protein